MYLKIAFVFFLIVTTSLMSIEKITLNSDFNKLENIEPYIEIYEDTTQQNTIETIFSLYTKGEFSPLNKKYINYGYSKSTFWITFELENQTNKNKTYTLEVGKPYHDELRLYKQMDLNFTESVNGSAFTFDQRDIKYRFALFKIEMQANEKVRYFLKVKSNNAIAVPLRLYSTQSLVEKVSLDQLLLGAHYGVIAIMIFYNLFLFLLIREWLYLHYTFYISGLLLFLTVLNGIAFQYFWPNSVFLAQNLLPYLGILYPVFAFQFTRILLDTKRYNPILDYLLIGLGLFHILILFGLSFITIEQQIMAMMLTGLIWPPILFFVGIANSIAGNNMARFYIAGWSFFLGGVIILIFRSFGMIDPSFFTDYAMQIGITLEVILLSFALSDRINLLKRERQEAQEKLATELESLVAQRTEELELANQKLNKLSITDALTQLYNRGHLDEMLEYEFSSHQRSDRNLSFIMCDIDFFKPYNDTYGHPEGDACIQQVASVIKESLTRPNDIAARYGGEEFAVLLPNTSKDGALKIAERIRLGVEELKIPHQKSRVKSTVTISLGICTMAPKLDDAIMTLVQSADSALYQSKLDGRNKTTVF